ncbi:hypothetical protein FUA23_15260 [Neolewinella aurantiaca]|uniref:Lipoprotein n=1 Tax=Neolewinella aurantiaca TaxID=2602767 RepID=A0A5C7FBS2_9BACT|nr:hypothetical protein [Neolewinella aurantiaca]TXF88336.1 hypothetical protein FUA23_15260 [Neolewinella aurantiaca]
MNRNQLFYTAVFFLAVAFSACQDAPAATDTDETAAPATYAETASPAAPEPAAPAAAQPAAGAKSATTKEALAADDPFVISGGAVLGIRPGDPIAGVNNTKKSTVKTAEGRLTIYELVDEGDEKLGYLQPDPRDAEKIGSIHISSGMFSTPEGIAVGDTYAELEKALGNITPHGSEVTNKTWVQVGQTRFILNQANRTYELGKGSVKPDAKIEEIVVVDPG